MIRLEDVDLEYAGHVALSRLTCRIGTGESVALIGANGSGKSSLLKLLNGLVASSRGSYHYDGLLIDAKYLADPLKARRFHKRIGLLFQNAETQLFCPTVREEILYGPRQLGLEAAALERRLADSLELLSIAGLVDRSPFELSEGEKKKVALAAVLALNPEVLCLDEPLSGLDPRSQRELIGVLQALRAAGKTLICATHEFDYLDGLFERVLIFGEDHRLVADGDYARLVADRPLLETHNII